MKGNKISGVITAVDLYSRYCGDLPEEIVKRQQHIKDVTRSQKKGMEIFPSQYNAMSNPEKLKVVHTTTGLCDAALKYICGNLPNQAT